MKKNCSTLLLLAAMTAGLVAGERQQPFVLDVAALDRAEVKQRADKALVLPVATVVQKPRPSPTGSSNDYVSYGRYWWPDPARSNGLPYLRRDGHVNSDLGQLGDAGRLERMISSVIALADAWTLEHRTNCALRAGEWLRAWFIYPATRMRPSLAYAQIRLGHDSDAGSSSGIIDTHRFPQLMDALRELNDSPALTDQESRQLKQWFSDYLQWLATSKNGQREHGAPNNHGSWYLAQTISIARYLGRDGTARELAREDFPRIASQFGPDGVQPLEIIRTDGLSYSRFNLEAQFTVAQLAAPLGVDLWHYQATNGASLRKGFEYVLPYNTAPDRWPHNQLKKTLPGHLDSLAAQADHVWPGVGSQAGK